MTRVDPWLSVKKVEIIGCFDKKPIVEVNHASGDPCIPLLGYPISIARLNLTLDVHKLDTKLVHPKVIRFMSQLFKGWLKYAFLSLGHHLLIHSERIVLPYILNLFWKDFNFGLRGKEVRVGCQSEKLFLLDFPKSRCLVNKPVEHDLIEISMLS